MNDAKASRKLGISLGVRLLLALLSISLFHAELRSKSTYNTPNLSEQAKISVTADLVVLPVNVTDANGVFVSGLEKDQFGVYEEGRIQKITLFREEDAPVTVGILVDHSRSMGPKLEEVTTAVSAFVHSSNPEDEMFVVDFSDDVNIELLDGKAFTSDVRVLERAVSMVSARGQTALYDAVAEGLKHLELGNREKKALVIVSDGGDNASRYNYSEVLSLARQAHTVIYSIGLVGSTEEENPRALEKLCRETGGIAFFPRAGQRTSDIAEIIARDLREQYTLGYAPEKVTGGSSFRKIAVKVEVSGRGKLRVRTRAGYLARTTKASTSEPGAGGQ